MTRTPKKQPNSWSKDETLWVSVRINLPAPVAAQVLPLVEGLKSEWRKRVDEDPLIKRRQKEIAQEVYNLSKSLPGAVETPLFERWLNRQRIR